MYQPSFLSQSAWQCCLHHHIYQEWIVGICASGRIDIWNGLLLFAVSSSVQCGHLCDTNILILGPQCDTDYTSHLVCRASRLAEITKANKRYAEQHLKNSSTRGVLAAAFTPEVADEYMTHVMFDSV